MDEFEMVSRMYEHFGLAERAMEGDEPEPHLLSDAVTNFRLRALREELDELRRAYEREDMVEVADALVDLVVFALGTARLHNLPWDELFTEVHCSNMAKVVGPGVRERGPGQVDLLKPPGWTPPDIGGVLARHRRKRRHE